MAKMQTLTLFTERINANPFPPLSRPGAINAEWYGQGMVTKSLISEEHSLAVVQGKTLTKREKRAL